MKFGDVIKALEGEILDVVPADLPEAAEVKSIHTDSRLVKPGGLFVAIGGARDEPGHYAGHALQRGAVAVVTESESGKNANIRVRNSDIALSRVSAAFYGHPSAKLFMVGTTGTNGKTTVTYIIENIFKAAGKNAGFMGTVNYRYGGRVFDTSFTTPEAHELQKRLFEMKNAGVSHVAMEVSSHGIELARVADCAFDVGVFTNLSHDHLDFHKDMESYGECKKGFFTKHLAKGDKPGTQAVINVDDAWGREIYDSLDMQKLSVGINANASVTCENVSVSLDCIKGRIITPKGGFDFMSPLTGEHNLENILCAAGAGLAAGMELTAIKSGIENTKRIPGRLEGVKNDRNRFVLVDYAHTPDALENVLSTLKRLSPGKVITVFGCGGDRDRDKRPKMGEIAARLSDLCIITSDNPRTEEPLNIMKDILQGTVRHTTREYNAGEPIAEKGFMMELDRRKAIEAGIAFSETGDTVLIAGKGHEDYQILGRDKIDFDDRIEAAKALEGVKQQ